MTLKVLPYILIGIAIGAIIHGYAPEDFLLNIAGPDNPLAVPIAVLIGIPLYSNAAGMLPIMQVLTSKGMAIGTALAFMMAVVGLSLPEMIILRRVIKIKLIAIFVGILFVAITLTGLLFNAILG
ncbi:MAG: permease [Methanomicrobiales archaeon]